MISMEINNKAADQMDLRSYLAEQNKSLRGRASYKHKESTIEKYFKINFQFLGTNFL